MPNYDFECTSCGERFERQVEVGTTAVECPSCGSEEAERKFTSFGLVSRQMTSSQRRKRENSRGIDRGGALARFKAGRKRAR